MAAPLPVLRRDALHAGLATLDAGESSPALEDAYRAALNALPFSERLVVSDMIAAAGVTVERWRTAALTVRTALGHVLDCSAVACKTCAAAGHLVRS